MGDLGSIPEWGRSPGEGKSYLLQYSGLENSVDCIVHGMSKSQTRLSDFHFYFPNDIVIKAVWYLHKNRRVDIFELNLEPKYKHMAICSINILYWSQEYPKGKGLLLQLVVKGRLDKVRVKMDPYLTPPTELTHNGIKT